MPFQPEDCDSGQDHNQAERKKRKVKPARACDICRRKKIRCDGPQGPENKCMNCITFKTDCKYGEVAKKRGPPKGYTQTLETRVAKLEDLLRKHCPNLDLEKEVGGPLNKQSYRNGQVESTQKASENNASNVPVESTTRLPEQTRHSSGSPSAQTDVDSSDDEYIQNSLAEEAQRLSINPSHNRFLGKASGVSLIEAAIQLKVEETGSDIHTVTSDWGAERREQFWTVPSWEITMYQDGHPEFVFPEPDLIPNLVDLHFKHVNSLSPLLHRPTFDANIRDELHLHNHKFAAVLLAVCALGARFSDDPRVFLDGPETVPHSAGWKYFDQVHRYRRSIVAPPTLYDLQIFPLMCLFLLGSSAPHAAWSIIGMGTRLAEDVGANKRRFYGSELNVETELWKRAFWILVTAERGIAAALGRQCTFQDEDIDVEWPMECDDEYWTNEDPSKAFKQPAGKVSYITYYLYGLRLANIQGAALRTLYSTGRRRTLFGQIGQDWEERTVADMDSTLNRWFDDMPDHLRWIPTSDDPIFFRQSAQIYCAYYYNQILIHRPFISRKPTQLTMSCMAICTNAARSIISISEVLRKRREIIPGIIVATFGACVILTVHVLGGKKAGISSDPVKGMQDVHKGLELLQLYEERWHLAGAYWDIVWDLCKICDLPLPSRLSNLKRARSTSTGPSQPFHQALSSLARMIPLRPRSFKSDFKLDPAPTISAMDAGASFSTGPTVTGHGTHVIPALIESTGTSNTLPASMPTRMIGTPQLARNLARRRGVSASASTQDQGRDQGSTEPMFHQSGEPSFQQSTEPSLQLPSFPNLGEMAQETQFMASNVDDDLAAVFSSLQPHYVTGLTGQEAAMYYSSAVDISAQQQLHQQTAMQPDELTDQPPAQNWSFFGTPDQQQFQPQQYPNQGLDNNMFGMWSGMPASTYIPDDWTVFIGDMTNDQQDTFHTDHGQTHHHHGNL